MSPPQYRKDKPSPWVVQYTDVYGKRRTQSFRRKEDAEEFELKQIRTRQLLKAGLEAPREEILLFDFAKKFLSQRFKTMPRSTVAQDESRLRNYWLEKFGTRPLQAMTSSEIKEHLDYIQFELNHSAADRNRHRALMHKLFQEALMEDKVIFNPVSKIPLVDEKKKRRRVGHLDTPEDQEKYIRAAYEESFAYGTLAVILIWAGPRISEAIALQHRDIDYQRQTIRIRRTFERASQSLQERTKGQKDGGEYILPLFPRVKDAILSFKRQSQFTRPSDFIVHRSDGAHVSYDTFKEVHRRILTAAGLQPITIHDLRRTFASNAQKAGFSKGEIQEMLGHSSVTVTERYTILEIDHLIEKGRRIGFGTSEDAERIIEIRGGNK